MTWRLSFPASFGTRRIHTTKGPTVNASNDESPKKPQLVWNCSFCCCCISKDLTTAILESNVPSVKKNIQSLAGRIQLNGTSPLDPKDRDHGETVLTLAIQCQQQDVIDLLVNARHTESINVVNSIGMAPIHYAAYLGQSQTIHNLIQRRASLNAATTDALITPLMLASFQKHTTVVRALLDAGADLEKQDDAGWTALFYAVWSGSADIVQMLLEEGVHRHSQDKAQCNALDLAESMGFRDISSLLRYYEVTLASPEPTKNGVMQN